MNSLNAPSVRLATAVDAEDITRLAGQLGYCSTTDETCRRLRAIVGRDEHAVYVAESGGTLIGWIHAFVRHTLVADTPAEIAALVVDEKVRGRGIGRMLLQQAELWAAEHGCHSVTLRSNVVRSRAHAFYERLGYELTKHSKSFRKQLP